MSTYSGLIQVEMSMFYIDIFKSNDKMPATSNLSSQNVKMGQDATRKPQITDKHAAAEELKLRRHTLCFHDCHDSADGVMHFYDFHISSAEQERTN